MNGPAEGFKPLFRSSPVIDLIGPVYSKGEGADLVFGLRVEAKHCNMRGTLHGGILSVGEERIVRASAVFLVAGELKER